MKILMALLLSIHAASGWAHGEKHGNAEAQPARVEDPAFGREGDPNAVTRVVTVGMHDPMRFTPPEIAVKRGETVRFRVKNHGKVRHEMVLGTLQDLKAHAEMMRKHPGMAHDAPYMAHVAPGKTETFVWQFTQPGEFYYGCLVAGHFEAGMIGKVKVAP